MAKQAKKVKGYTIIDKKPEAGDLMICVNRKSVNYGQLSVPAQVLINVDAVDTKNWKVVMTKEDRQQQIVDEVIESLKKDFAVEDYTVLEELLKMLDNKALVLSLNENDWNKFPEVKEQIK